MFVSFTILKNIYFTFWNCHRLTEKLQGQYFSEKKDLFFTESFERKFSNQCPVIPKYVNVWFLWSCQVTSVVVQLFVTRRTVAHEVPLSMGSSSQEYWSALPCPSPGDLPEPGMEPVSLMSPALAGAFFTISATWEALTRTFPTLLQDNYQNEGIEVDIHTMYAVCSVVQLCPTLCDPMDCSLLDSSVHGDSPEKNTGVGCHPSSRGSSQPRGGTQSPALQLDSLPAEPPDPISIFNGSHTKMIW